MLFVGQCLTSASASTTTLQTIGCSHGLLLCWSRIHCCLFWLLPRALPSAQQRVQVFALTRDQGASLRGPQSAAGHILAFAALFLLFVALRMSLGENPPRSKMRWLEEWQRLLLLGAIEAYLAKVVLGSALFKHCSTN